MTSRWLRFVPQMHDMFLELGVTPDDADRWVRTVTAVLRGVDVTPQDRRHALSLMTGRAFLAWKAKAEVETGLDDVEEWLARQR
jgi:hypothetical protein